MNWILLQNKMMMTIKKNTLYNLLILLVAAVISVITFVVISKGEQQLLKSRVFRGISGWGYDILVDDKLFIRQESIPVLKGTHGFETKEQAQQTADLIINKMERGQLPTVTIFEIRHICELSGTYEK